MEHASGPQPSPAQRGAVAEPAAPALGQEDGQSFLADHRPAALAQRRMAQAIQGSARATAQRVVGDRVNASAPMAAQRQRMASLTQPAQQQTAQRAAAGPAPDANRTGMPDGLKSGIESLSGVSMDSVRVHYNSAQPAQLNALAYAQGNDIHLGPGQERHLPHEAWHVVQQAQGRVRPTMQMKAGTQVNDDAGLEREADVMGARAAQLYSARYQAPTQRMAAPGPGGVVQRLVGFEFETTWDLRKPGGMAWDSDTVLVRGQGWQISPDEISGNAAKIEFKTQPFDVDGDDPVALVAPIGAAFTGMRSYIDARLAGLAEGHFVPLATQIPAAQGVEVQPNGPLTAKPQVTGGVRTDLVFSFLRDMASADQPAGLLPGEEHRAGLGTVLDRVGGDVDERSKDSREYWGVVVLLADLVSRFQADKDAAVAEYTVWRTQTRADLLARYQAWVARVHPTPEQEAAKQQEVDEHFNDLKAARQEEIRAQHAPSYAKARSPALPRVAFNDLPQVLQANLLRDVLQAAGLAHPADGARRMFPLGMRRNADLQVTIAQWITRIKRRLLAGEEGELWSARSLGAGPVGPAPTRGTGIPFELRGIPGPLPYAEWPAFIQPYLLYFSNLNRRQR